MKTNTIKVILFSTIAFAIVVLIYWTAHPRPVIHIENGEVTGLDLSGKEWATLEIEYMILKGVEAYKNSKK
jgi:hypothetical protein